MDRGCFVKEKWIVGFEIISTKKVFMNWLYLMPDEATEDDYESIAREAMRILTNVPECLL